MTTDCEQLNGKLRDFCRGHDDDGNPVSPPSKREKWLQYFHGETTCDEGKGKLLTLEQQERVAKVEENKARTQRLIGWLTFLRLPDDRGVGDTASRLLPTGKQSPYAGALIKRLLAQCACKPPDAVAKLNAEHPYPAQTRNRGGS
jgi:hypothetical protein